MMPKTISRRDCTRSLFALLPFASFRLRPDKDKPVTLAPARLDDRTESWLQHLQGKHKQIFHTTNVRDGRALRMINAYLEGYARSYGVPERAVNAILATQGPALMMLFNDDVWKTFNFGRLGRFTDPLTMREAVRNPFRTGGDKEVVPSNMSIEGLTKRGVIFLACNNELRSYARELGFQTRMTEATAYSKLKNGLLPGVIVVPAMPISIGRAQEHGCTYISIQ